MTQKFTVLLLLQTRGFKGVSAHELIYGKGITRGAAIIHELRNEGFEIDTINEGDSKLARYVLHSANVPPVPCTCGHRKRVHLWNEGHCLDMLNPDEITKPPIYCDCESYRVA